MARVSRVRRLKSSFRNDQVNPCRIPTCSHKALKGVNNKKHKSWEKKDWEDATCAVCMESPHNAVLLLCSSYNKGCRPYMCATSQRFSNCLEQYKKAYTKAASSGGDVSGLGSCWSDGKVEVSELLCPLCRGQVKGWTVVEAARKYLNKKKRTCMQDNCSFVGSFKQLKKHVKTEHPWARPRDVDPEHEEKWKRLEQQREYRDVMSALGLSPGSIVVGDYVIEQNYNPFYRNIEVDDDGLLDEYSDDDLSDGPFSGNRGRNSGFHLRPAYRRAFNSYDDGDDNDRVDVDDDDDDITAVRRRVTDIDSVLPVSRHHRRRMLLLGRSGWRRRRSRPL